jgi:hypothetical protein
MAKINSLSIVGAIIVITTFVSSVLAEDGQIFVGTSDQTKFVSTGSSVLAVQPVQAGASFLVGDVNGDGKADIVVFQHGTQTGTGVYVGLSNGSSFAPAQKWNDYFCVSPNVNGTGAERCAVGDVNGDGKADIVVFQHGTQAGTGVYVGRSNGSSFAPAKKWNDYFCVGQQEACAVGDVNGDRQADVIAFRTPPLIGPH